MVKVWAVSPIHQFSWPNNSSQKNCVWYPSDGLTPVFTQSYQGNLCSIISKLTVLKWMNTTTHFTLIIETAYTSLTAHIYWVKQWIHQWISYKWGTLSHKFQPISKSSSRVLPMLIAKYYSIKDTCEKEFHSNQTLISETKSPQAI